MVRTAGGGRWRLAASLDRLFDELNAAYPKRDRATDGWLGDTSHQRRESEHNPDGRGIVHAIDVDKDGIDVKRLLRAAVGHPAVWYVIFDGVIWSRTHGWKARRYTGPNPHRGHVHISGRLAASAEDWSGKWLAKEIAKAREQRATDKHEPGSRTLRKGDRGTDVKVLQKKLGVRDLVADGVFGKATETAVNRVKRSKGFAQDGTVGPGTWAHILRSTN